MFERRSCQIFSGHSGSTTFFWFYIDAETFDRATSKFLLSLLWHMKYDVFLYQSIGDCLYFAVLNIV